MFSPIGYVENRATTVPRHWSVSDEEGAVPDLHPGHQAPCGGRPGLILSFIAIPG